VPVRLPRTSCGSVPWMDSAGIARHVREAPIYRRPIVAVLREAARKLPPGTRVLDAGAGKAPYRSLFEHCVYVTADWPGTVHAEALESDVVADLHDLPLDAASFDAVLCTEVLEHVEEPPRVLAELHRVLRSGGTLVATVPFVHGLHEEPYDVARYTNHALHRMLTGAGFDEVVIRPLAGGYSVASAALLEVLFHSVVTRVRAGVPRLIAFRVWRALHLALAFLAAKLDRYDRPRMLPLGWSVVARKPAATVNA
jgi:SAM-dependent methyltransferase